MFFFLKSEKENSNSDSGPVAMNTRAEVKIAACRGGGEAADGRDFGRSVMNVSASPHHTGPHAPIPIPTYEMNCTAGARALTNETKCCVHAGVWSGRPSALAHVSLRFPAK